MTGMMSPRLRNLLIAGVVVGIAAELVVLGFPRNKWSSGRRIIEVNLSVTDADNAQPIAGTKITVFDHPTSTASGRSAALDGAEYHVEVFTSGADGSCRFHRVFPLYTMSLLQSKDNMRRPGTWAKISAPGHIPILVGLDRWLPFPPKDSSDEEPLVMSFDLASGDDQPLVIPDGYPTVANGFRYQWQPASAP
jgi:hypothetical protein